MMAALGKYCIIYRYALTGTHYKRNRNDMFNDADASLMQYSEDLLKFGKVNEAHLIRKETGESKMIDCNEKVRYLPPYNIKRGCYKQNSDGQS
mmetsp:Transcript_11117/g.10642  ORF Transcript_11117/g.10642 Transcript_11117/m.10642 type:complete len:93 (+) Transcript_11117:41-319(+)